MQLATKSVINEGFENSTEWQRNQTNRFKSTSI